EIDTRKKIILKLLNAQGKLSDELRNKIEPCYVMAELEDLYLPFKPKRKTRATIARAMGLAPLADALVAQSFVPVGKLAQKFLTDEVPSIDEALAGARDIVAEWVSENERARGRVRNLFEREASIASKVIKGKEERGDKYANYFDYSRPLCKCPSHALLAMRRGEAEGFLRVTIAPHDHEVAVQALENLFVKNDSESAAELRTAIADSYKRLLAPSIENEMATITKDQADEAAIRVFADNLRQLLLAAPIGQKNVLAIDPGFRSGCKLVCLDAQGNLRHNDTIFPHPPIEDRLAAARKIASLVEQYKIEVVAIGNGTAGRETEEFVQNLSLDRKVQVFEVSEDGASIYSASPLAREEFPEYDVTVRGAISIGRRLIDPLAELVKIDPKSIGVGQYQHDVNQTKLKHSLEQTVESCVNLVGVNLNTASKHLLAYVSGLGSQLAQNIVDWRKENGAFASRSQLREVSRLGVKVFEQCAGFLRIGNAANPLDGSAVHPENYHVVEKMAQDQNCTVSELLQSEEKRKQIDVQRYVSGTVGLPTLADIMRELAKPGLDPRKPAKVFEFAHDVHRISDLKTGMVLPGIVTNVTNFGAFVNIGAKKDGLVHVSQLPKPNTGDPTAAVKLHQHIMVRVLDVDISRGWIKLSMRDLQDGVGGSAT
ncbi:MAG: RNA-binding transcriptional accessory protein, partial [Prevotellaceae bacterium]|nr:RNA-binding transcriptional accessory protein [Prevotellaceae bacterium]